MCRIDSVLLNAVVNMDFDNMVQMMNNVVVEEIQEQVDQELGMDQIIRADIFYGVDQRYLQGVNQGYEPDEENQGVIVNNNDDNNNINVLPRIHFLENDRVFFNHRQVHNMNGGVPHNHEHEHEHEQHEEIVINHVPAVLNGHAIRYEEPDNPNTRHLIHRSHLVIYLVAIVTVIRHYLSQLPLGFKIFVTIFGFLGTVTFLSTIILNYSGDHNGNYLYEVVNGIDENNNSSTDGLIL